MPASRRREAITSALVSSFGNATRASPIRRSDDAPRSGPERDDVLLFLGIVARDDRDDRLVVGVLGVVRDPRRDEQEVAGVRLERELQLVTPVMDRAAADDIHRRLELAVRVRLGARMWR